MYLPIDPSIYLSIYLSIYSTHVSICRSIISSIRLSIHPSIYPSIYLSIPGHLFEMKGSKINSRPGSAGLVSRRCPSRQLGRFSLCPIPEMPGLVTCVGGSTLQGACRPCTWQGAPWRPGPVGPCPLGPMARVPETSGFPTMQATREADFGSPTCGQC